jgi:hypothetical protein
MKTMSSFVVCYKSAIDAAIKIIVVLPRETKFEQDSFKSFAKFCVENAINDRVEG